jgi:hypothetical protein
LNAGGFGDGVVNEENRCNESDLAKGVGGLENGGDVEVDGDESMFRVSFFVDFYCST